MLRRIVVSLKVVLVVSWSVGFLVVNVVMMSVR